MAAGMSAATANSVDNFHPVHQSGTENPVKSCNEGECCCLTAPEIEICASALQVPYVCFPGLWPYSAVSRSQEMCGSATDNCVALSDHPESVPTSLYLC